MNEQAPAPGQGTPLGSPQDVLSTGRAVREMFERVVLRYDFLNHFLSAGRDIAWRRAAAKALRGVLERPDSVALDVCSGTGDLAFALKRFSRGLVIGADFCPPMILRAKQKARELSLSVPFLEADTLALPVRDNSLDLISVAFGFRNLAHYAMGLREMHRALKPGGTIAILEFSRVRWPVIGPLFRFYFRKLLPRIGTLVSGVSGPYQYLPDSVSKFPDQEALAGLLRAQGFVNVRYKNYSLGAAALHLGEKSRTA